MLEPPLPHAPSRDVLDASQSTLPAIAPVRSVAINRVWPKRLWLWIVLAGVGLGMAASLRPEPRLRKPSDFQAAYVDHEFPETVARLNREFEESITRAHLLPAAEADWRTICRRLSLALVGNGLSLEELRAIEQVPEADRVRWWTNYLLQDRRSSDYLAERFTRAYVGTNNGPFFLFRRRKFNLWLADQFEKGVPYDQIVRSLITAEGLWTDQPSVNFLTATMDEADNRRADPVRLAGRTTRAFLGMRIDCLQCHDDFLNKINLGSPENPIRGVQQQFHQLAAFYSGARLPENVFSGLRDDEKEYAYKYLDAIEESIITPQVPFSAELLPTSGRLRQRLATWVTHADNLAFSRATVNRIWALMLGRPLVSPVDDIPLAGPFPPGLEILSHDFSKHAFDLKRLIRIISESDVFRRDSRSEAFAVTTAHEQAWAVFPLTQLRPEQVAASIHQACRLKAIDENSAIISQIEKFGYVNDFTKAYGDRGEDEFVEQSVTIPQRLLVMNGQLVTERTKPNPIVNASSRIGTLAATDEQAVDAIYLATLNRNPSIAERKAMSEMLAGTRGESRGRAVSDLYWILLNSTEFLWNH